MVQNGPTVFFFSFSVRRKKTKDQVCEAEAVGKRTNRAAGGNLYSKERQNHLLLRKIQHYIILIILNLIINRKKEKEKQQQQHLVFFFSFSYLIGSPYRSFIFVHHLCTLPHHHEQAPVGKSWIPPPQQHQYRRYQGNLSLAFLCCILQSFFIFCFSHLFC